MHETIVLNGKNLATALNEQTKEKIEQFALRTLKKPRLDVILVGDNKASHTYVANKKNACERVGINVCIHNFSSNIDQEIILSLVDELNRDDQVHGILLQLPLPQGWDKKVLIERILMIETHFYSCEQLLLNIFKLL